MSSAWVVLLPVDVDGGILGRKRNDDVARGSLVDRAIGRKLARSYWDGLRGVENGGIEAENVTHVGVELCAHRVEGIQGSGHSGFDIIHEK